MKTSISLLILLLLGVIQTHAQTLPGLKVSENQRFLLTTDDEPFFWLGDTAWELIHRLNREEARHYFKDRSEKGFTIIQTVILAELDGLNTPNAYGHKPLINNDPKQCNEAYFAYVDELVDMAASYGLYLGLLPTWGDKFNLKWGAGPVIFNPENAEVYGEFLGRRYGSKTNIVWILGGDRIPEEELHFQIVDAMAAGLMKTAPGQLITYHPAGAHIASSYFNDSWLDMDMFQSGHQRNARDYNYVRESLKISPARPVVNGEPRYENIQDQFWLPGDHEWLDDADVRVSAYWSILAGAAGYTYGCHDIWQMYTIDKQTVSKARTGWKEALHLPGSRQMQFFKALFTTFPWHQMVNDQSLIVNENPENLEYRMAARNVNNEFFLVYTPYGRTTTVDLTKLAGKNASCWWFNPRSGEYQFIGKVSTSEKKDFTPLSDGRGSDFVLVIESEQSQRLKTP
jgi:hypothetical protein